MTVTRPSDDELREIAAELHLHIPSNDIGAWQALLASGFAAYDTLDDLPDHRPGIVHPRTAGYRPGPDEDPNNAWFVKSEVKGSGVGKLSGRTVALKDNICLAGVPMMNGASVLEGYVPDVDATVVTRILDDGGTILGKANCEYLCFSAGSHTSANGPTHNPHRRGYSAGGSSSGSAAAVAAGEADMALGCDQGGSIRVPAAFCGICGMKPTYGLVPYTGIMPMEVTLDHVGPMTRTVADNALLLEVLAGPDGLDARQGGAAPGPYTGSASAGVAGLRIGIVAEGFGLDSSEPGVDACVRSAALALARLGALVEDVSIPMHPLGNAIRRAIAAEGGTQAMFAANSFGRGLYVTGLGDAFAAWRGRADELPDALKLSMLLGRTMTRRHGGHFYAKAQNLSRRLRLAYDEAFGRFDLLVMPTTPMRATPLPPPGSPRELLLRRSGEPLANTAPFNCTGHPAMSVPCGSIDGMPVGLMLVGKHHDEAVIYRGAACVEAAARCAHA